MSWLFRLFALGKSIQSSRQTAQQAGARVRQANQSLRAATEKRLGEVVAQAQAGSAAAQFDLAEHIYEGLGFRQDYAQAAGWFERAAEQGHVPAQINLALLYSLGRGVPRDPELAWKWICQAARSGDPRALRIQSKLRQAGSPPRLD